MTNGEFWQWFSRLPKRTSSQDNLCVTIQVFGIAELNRRLDVHFPPQAIPLIDTRAYKIVRFTDDIYYCVFTNYEKAHTLAAHISAEALIPIKQWA